jgi:hypothetical protein
MLSTVAVGPFASFGISEFSWTPENLPSCLGGMGGVGGLEWKGKVALQHWKVIDQLSRPHVSNDSSFSESQVKTLKDSSEFPDRFGCLQDVQSFLLDFFEWYNTIHQHSGLGWLTPWDVHHGRAEQRFIEREAILRTAFAATPERFVRGAPTPPEYPRAVWINKPRSLKEVIVVGDRER